MCVFFKIHILFGISTCRCLTKHSKRVKQKTFSAPTDKIVKQNRTHSTFTCKLTLTKFLTSSGRGFTVQFETYHGINALIIFCHFTIIRKVVSFPLYIWPLIISKHWIKFSMNFFNSFLQII